MAVTHQDKKNFTFSSTLTIMYSKVALGSNNILYSSQNMMILYTSVWKLPIIRFLITEVSRYQIKLA